jgi:hypothetical protein
LCGWATRLTLEALPDSASPAHPTAALSASQGAVGSRCRRKCPTASEPVKAQDVFGPDTGTLLFDHPFEECRFHLRRTLPTGGDPQRHEAIDAGTTNVVGVENTLVLSLWTI